MRITINAIWLQGRSVAVGFQVSRGDVEATFPNDDEQLSPKDARRIAAALNAAADEAEALRDDKTRERGRRRELVLKTREVK